MNEDTELERNYMGCYRAYVAVARSKYVSKSQRVLAKMSRRSALHALLMAGYCRADVRELQARVLEVGA